MLGSRDTFPVRVRHSFLTPVLRPKRDISCAQGNSIWADSWQHDNDRASAMTFGKPKAGGAVTEVSPGLGTGGAEV